MGMVTMYRCGYLVGVVVRRYIDILTIIINFSYSTCISSILVAASLLLCSFSKCFFDLVYMHLGEAVTRPSLSIC